MARLSDSDLRLRARREILQLKPGTRIPGYTGHCPGLQFGFGNTYGELTHIMSIREDNGKNVQNDVQNIRCSPYQTKTTKQVERPKKFHLPDPKNDSSAIEELLRGSILPHTEIYKRGRRFVSLSTTPPSGYKSGYTGYVPGLRYQMGSNFNASSEEAFKEFQALQANGSDSTQKVMSALVNSKYPDIQNSLPLLPVTDNQHILDALHSLKMEQLKDNQKGLLEPPTVGYQGHIPRLRPTTVQVGQNYHQAARAGLQSFYEAT